MNKVFRDQLSRVVVLVVLYVLLGNARSIQPNPFIPGAIVAVYMIVPVTAGLLFGRHVGLLVGLLGTFFNALSPAGTEFEWLAIIPHTIMGFMAGWLNESVPSPIAALSLLIGHGLNLTAYLFVGLVELATVQQLVFWYGLGYESLIEIVTIIVIVAIYRMGFERNDIKQ